MARLGPIVLVTVALFFGGCCKLNKASTLTNLKNVAKISLENDAHLDQDEEMASSLKMAAKSRNEQARNLAREMALSAGNTEVEVTAAMASSGTE